MQYKEYENILFTVISLLTGLGIVYYYSSSLPDFDIGFNEAFTTAICGMLAFVLWAILSYLFHFIGKQVSDTRKSRPIKIAAMLIYWLIVWGFCYYQCTIKAVQDWNDMMNGNVG